MLLVTKMVFVFQIMFLLFNLLSVCSVFLEKGTIAHGALQLKVKSNILGPPLPHKPFVAVWNAASERCEEKFGVPLNLSDFDIVYNENKGWRGDAMVIFYADQLGYYPHIDDKNNTLNGGIPQLGDLDAHLTKAKEDIINFIPDPDFRGLAVIDWEPWHPLWDRMTWGTYVLYQTLSIEKVQKEHPDWSEDKVINEAKSEYETAAWGFISFTLSLAKIVRPNALWGFYLYPDCYNYNKTGDKESLICSNKTLQYNDEIQWVFDKSTGLYPSIYLGEWFGNKYNAVYYVANRVLEAVRVDTNRKSDVTSPIYAYHLLTYRKESQFLDIFDLRNSIGVASVLGASGIVIWGDYNLANSLEECKNLSSYISNVLGPYVKMTSEYAFQCSITHCSANGRCVLTNYQSKTSDDEHYYLTADDAWEIIKKFDKSAYKLFDDVQEENIGSYYSIICQCYDGWHGNDCSEHY